jgi:hypothetical protein
MPIPQPFQNETDTTTIGDLTIENRVDQLELYGSLSITRDQNGLRQALALKKIIDDAVAHLQAASDLPEVITFRPLDSVDNPVK